MVGTLILSMSGTIFLISSSNSRLLRSNLIELAQSMVTNQLYQIDHYGTVLNANRTYYLFRSQPPFLSTMVLDLFEQTHDRKFLENSFPTLEKFYHFYMSEPHIISQEFPLSRFYALGDGPCDEVVFSEMLYGKSHYQRVEEFYKNNGGLTFVDFFTPHFLC